MGFSGVQLLFLTVFPFFILYISYHSTSASVPNETKDLLGTIKYRKQLRLLRKMGEGREVLMGPRGFHRCQIKSSQRLLLSAHSGLCEMCVASVPVPSNRPPYQIQHLCWQSQRNKEREPSQP